LSDQVNQQALSGNPVELLASLHAMEEKSGRFNALILVSLGGLPLQNAKAEFWKDFDHAMSQYRERHEAKYYTLTQDERGFLVKMNEFNEVRLLPDLKVELLRLIQRYFPENFGMIDQSRLLRMVDLRIRLSNAIRFLDRLIEKPKEMEAASKVMRKLQEEDINQVEIVSQKLGAEQFCRAFIQHQKVAIIHPSQPPTDVMNEYFVSMGALNDHVFKNVELRGAGNLFNQLTLTLDTLLLEAYGELNPGRAKCSINMNVESVFSKSFQKVLENTGDATFSNVVFEFRQSNILQNFEEFMVACELIRSHNGTIAIDAIFPETIGIVNLARLNANLAKIFWRSGAEDILPKYREEIINIQKSGTVLVLARLDDEIGLKMGHDLGITMFQGFYVDKLLESGS